MYVIQKPTTYIQCQYLAIASGYSYCLQSEVAKLVISVPG